VALPLGRGSSPIQLGPFPTQEAGAPQGVTPSLSPGSSAVFPGATRSGTALKREAAAADAPYAPGKTVTAGRDGSPSPSLHGLGERAVPNGTRALGRS
jgi:hypothetical protein